MTSFLRVLRNAHTKPKCTSSCDSRMLKIHETFRNCSFSPSELYDEPNVIHMHKCDIILEEKDTACYDKDLQNDFIYFYLVY